MLQFSLVWLLIGGLAGLLAYAAQIRLVIWTRLDWLMMMSIGAILALCGGWLGVLLLGKFFATAMAIWITIASLIVLSLSVCKRH